MGACDVISGFGNQQAYQQHLQQMHGMQQAQGVTSAQEYEAAVRQMEVQSKIQVEALKLKAAQAAKESKVDKELLPDISLTRVFKWAVVLVVAMALGRKVWDTFGPKITAQLHKALDSTQQ